MSVVKDRPAIRRQPKRDYLVNTLGEVAEFFGVGITTVGAWRIGDNPMPGDVGRFDLAAIAKWERARRKDGGGLNEQVKEADVRLKTAQAKAKELENSITESELLPASEVELWASTALIEAREMVMSLPEMLATSMPPDHREFVRSETDRHCRDVLTALRRRLESDPVESGSPPATAAEDSIG